MDAASACSCMQNNVLSSICHPQFHAIHGGSGAQVAMHHMHGTANRQREQRVLHS